MWTSSLRGTKPSRFGSRWSWLFLLVLLAFWPCSLSAQSQPSPASPQTPPSTQYSKMTRDELLTQIADKDKLLAEWLAWHDKVTTSQAEQEQAWTERVASRDKLIADQEVVIVARTKERDDALARLQRQEALGWLERGLWALGGAGFGYAVGDLTANR